MIEPAPQRFKVWRGVTFRKNILFQDENEEPKDLTGYTGVLEIRDAPETPENLVSLTSENGGIVFGGINGTIELFIDATDTETFDWDAAYYDLKVTTPSLDTDILLYGSFNVRD